MAIIVIVIVIIIMVMIIIICRFCNAVASEISKC